MLGFLVSASGYPAAERGGRSTVGVWFRPRRVDRPDGLPLTPLGPACVTGQGRRFGGGPGVQREELSLSWALGCGLAFGQGCASRWGSPTLDEPAR
jgi:hypothetical protein